MAYKLKKDPVKQIPKAQFVFWIIVRISMIICAVYSFVNGNIVMGFESVTCFIFSHLWDFFQVFGSNSFIIEVPPLSQTMLNIIIFVGIVLGSYGGLFEKVFWFDDFMHLISGLACAVFGYDFAFIIQRKLGRCASTLAAIFAFGFALTVACGWEFYEFAMDSLHGTNLQLAHEGIETAGIDLAAYNGEYGYYGLVDTMTDMIMNAIGGMAGMIFMIILRNRKKDKKKDKEKKNENTNLEENKD